MILDVERFCGEERPYWEQLDAEVGRLEQGGQPQEGVDHALRLHALYERAAADLARVRTYAADPALQEYLELLVARAHAACQPKGNARVRPLALARAFLFAFPCAFRRHLGAFLVSTGLMLAGSVIGAGLFLVDEETKPTVLPFSHLMESPSERVAREEDAQHDSSGDAMDMTMFSSVLMTNNIRVSILALAGGITCGVGTLLLLVYNGVILGVVGIDYVLDGQTLFLFAWLRPHGSVEIPSILIAGQAGLMIGGAMIGIGKGASLSARFRGIAGDLVTLIGGVAALLVWAAVIEAFLSQLHEPVVPYWLKITFGVAQLAALAWFLARSGKGGTSR